MTTTRQQREEVDPAAPRRPVRRVLKWLGIGLFAVVAAIAAYWALARSGAVPAPAPITPPLAQTAQPTPPQAAAPTAAAPATAAANGCLGGPDPAAGVLAAQRSAPMTTQGAAEFALSFIRWGISYPVDPNLGTTAQQVVVPGYLPEVMNGIVGGFSQNMADSGRVSNATTVGGDDQYRVVAADPLGASVTVSVLVYSHSEDAAGTSHPLVMTSTLILNASDGHWVVAGHGPAESNTFAPVTGAPWMPYSGVC